MADKTRGSKIKYRFLKKWRRPAAALLALAVLLGGMMLSGGKGNIVGVFGGVLVVGMLNNIMTLIGIPTFHQYLVTGLVFLFVVWLNTNSERKMGRA